MKQKIILIGIFTIAFFMMSGVQAQELVYRPINPSFSGGNPYNANWLFNEAQSQNKITESQTEYDRFERNPLEDFEESLNRQILSQISRQLVSSTFGEEQLTDGRYEIGNFVVDISEGAEGVTVSITDFGTGDETTVIVPYF